jgi:acetyl esterase/lipase
MSSYPMARIVVLMALRQAGGVAELHVFEGQSHAQYGFSYPSPESKDALSEVARFFDRHLLR